MKNMKKLFAMVLCLGMMMTMAACTEKKDETNSAASTAEQLTKVTVILDYAPNTNHTGIYAAKELGYYKEVGLNVEIIEPTEGATTTLIATGKGDFGISYQEDVTYALTSEDPLPIKAIATILQHNTSGFMTYKDKNITSVKDFEGKIYSGWGAPSEEAVIKAVMEKSGADFSKLSIITSDGSGYATLKDKVDVIWGFWGWDGIAAERAGVPINYMELKELDSRLDYYTPVIIANNDTLKNKPELAKKFLQATEKGYDYATKNVEDSAKILHKYAPDYDLEMLTESQKYLSAKYSEGASQWGVMKDEVWDNYTSFMVEYGLIKNAIPASECYTNDYLK